MGIDLINSNGGVEDIDPYINAEKTEKQSLFAGMKITAASPDTKKDSMANASNVQQHSLDKTQETAKTENVQATQQASESGMFGGLRIGAGKPSAAMKDTLGNGSNVSSNSLTDRV
ncbi:MAG: hypothetical protein LBQ03_00875 [Puniceicoccales bacterium]|jgi:hypothetical protein|nr:hypothetical protein [Puniceicoccales bacterium]